MPYSDRPVIITRPLAQAETLAAKLRDTGFDVRIFPLLDIQALPDTRELRQNWGN